MSSGGCACCTRLGVLVHKATDGRLLWVCGDCDWELTRLERRERAEQVATATLEQARLVAR